MPARFALSTLSAVSLPIVRAISIHESDHNSAADSDERLWTCKAERRRIYRPILQISERQRTWANIDMAERVGFETGVRAVPIHELVRRVPVVPEWLLVYSARHGEMVRCCNEAKLSAASCGVRVAWGSSNLGRCSLLPLIISASLGPLVTAS